MVEKTMPIHSISMFGTRGSDVRIISLRPSLSRYGNDNGNDWQKRHVAGFSALDIAARISVEEHGSFEPDFECEVSGGLS